MYIINRRRRAKKRAWIRSWLARREKESVYHRLLKELSLEDHETMRNWIRLDKDQYHKLLQLVTPLIAKDTRMRKAVTAGERLTLTLRYLATGESHASLGCQFRISHNLISSIIPSVCRAIYQVLKQQFLRFPTNQSEWQEVNYPSSLPSSLRLVLSDLWFEKKAVANQSLPLFFNGLVSSVRKHLLTEEHNDFLDSRMLTLELNSDHCKLNSDHCKLNSDHCKLNSDHCKLNSDHCKLNSDHCKLNSDHCKLNSDHCKLNSDHCKLNSDHCKLNSDHCKLNSDHCKLNSDHWKLNSDHLELNSDHLKLNSFRLTDKWIDGFPLLPSDGVSVPNLR
ncbi:hypothetical protein GWK47_006964 [Chionoecetes opilio]|uniref:Uncharacterized protein n=1 Tax=Chionoecetes opilio TaxID=41210 RepID=A0A8J4Y3E8_CHIOP|nr:hypothetical protein GWK47_006964 [Chionoecetes opilio]